MATWSEEAKTELIKKYRAANPTPETSMEIIKEIAEEMEQSPNGLRMILVTAGVYVKKEPNTVSKTKEGGTRVSKESQINVLKAILKDNGLPVDDEIIDKFTGKAATWLSTVLTQALAE